MAKASWYLISMTALTKEQVAEIRRPGLLDGITDHRQIGWAYKLSAGTTCAGTSFADAYDRNFRSIIKFDRGHKLLNKCVGVRIYERIGQRPDGLVDVTFITHL